MNFVFKMMDCVLKIMNFALKLMNFVFKMMNFVGDLGVVAESIHDGIDRDSHERDESSEEEY